ILVAFVIAAMVTFALFSAYREISLYRQSQREDSNYFVSRKRRNRRILISAVLLLESTFLFFGFFIIEFKQPHLALLYWLPALLLIVALVLLSLQDYRETSRDLDKIFEEASKSFLDHMKKKERLN